MINLVEFKILAQTSMKVKWHYPTPDMGTQSPSLVINMFTDVFEGKLSNPSDHCIGHEIRIIL